MKPENVKLLLELLAEARGARRLSQEQYDSLVDEVAVPVKRKRKPVKSPVLGT